MCAAAAAGNCLAQMQDEADAEAQQTAARHSQEQAAFEDEIARLKKSTKQANQDRDKAVAERQRVEGLCGGLNKEKQALQVRWCCDSCGMIL